MNDKPFFDTNIVLYAFQKNDPRGTRAEALLSKGGTISVQVLNEFAAVAHRKFNKNWKEVSLALKIVRTFCPDPLPVTVETHEQAVAIATQYGYSLYDSSIIAAALGARSKTLYSEDMNHGHRIATLTIRNPFIQRGLD